MAKITVTIKGGGLPRIKKYLEALAAGAKGGVKVGVLNGATYSEGPLAGELVAQNLARHEFGTVHIPARAPFRSTIAEKQKQWAELAADYLSRSAGEVDPRAALTQVGDMMAMDIQAAFETGLSPTLKGATVRHKTKMGYSAHASTPVMLTGTAQRSITSEYVDDISTVGGN